MDRVTIQQLSEMKRRGHKITMLTAYDYPLALLVDQAEIDVVLVGDSGGMVALGYETTVPVTMDEMLMMTQAVARAVRRALLIADMPFLSYEVSPPEAIRNAGRFLKEGGATAVKVERGVESAEVVRALVRAGIPVMGHVGLTPQSAVALSGYKVQGKDLTSARKIVEDARILEEAGAFAIILEAIPSPLADLITRRLRIPTIGIGAGPLCDGQVLVTYDLLGYFDRFTPKFVKRYAHLAATIAGALREYRKEVTEGTFPGETHSFTMDDETLRQLDGV